MRQTDLRQIPLRVAFVKKTALVNIFFRSLSIQASFSSSKMQSLGFTFALLPLIRREGDPKRRSESLIRHLQMFNTHPYLSAAVIGSVTRLEEDADTAAADHLKKTVMGPYAAIGDQFFWGALRSFAASAAVILALEKVLLAPLAFLLLYNPAHVWIRVKGFIEGYRHGKKGIDFIRGSDLPSVAGRVRLFSLVLIGILAAVAVDTAYRPWVSLQEIPVKAGALVLILLCLLGIRRGISVMKILYAMTLLCIGLSI